MCKVTNRLFQIIFNLLYYNFCVIYIYNPKAISNISIHCNNAIIIQAPGLPRETSSSKLIYRATTCLQKRSFKALANNDKPVYRQPKKLNPENALYSEPETDLIHKGNYKKDDLIWILSRYKSSEFLSDTQTVHCWTEFYHPVLKANAACPTNKVLYLLSLDQSLAKNKHRIWSTAPCETQNRSISNTKADLVLDHPILTESTNIQLKILLT